VIKVPSCLGLGQSTRHRRIALAYGWVACLGGWGGYQLSLEVRRGMGGVPEWATSAGCSCWSSSVLGRFYGSGSIHGAAMVFWALMPGNGRLAADGVGFLDQGPTNQQGRLLIPEDQQGQRSEKGLASGLDPSAPPPPRGPCCPPTPSPADRSRPNPCPSHPEPKKTQLDAAPPQSSFTSSQAQGTHTTHPHLRRLSCPDQTAIAARSPRPTRPHHPQLLAICHVAPGSWWAALLVGWSLAGKRAVLGLVQWRGWGV
jgi:hypothetical protein